jgi:L,D-transpeptidase catalytic domain
MRIITENRARVARLGSGPTAAERLLLVGRATSTLALTLACVGGCNKPAEPRDKAAPPAPSASAIATAPVATRDGGPGGGVDAGPVTLIGALFPQTPIMSDMDWPVHEDDRHPSRHSKEPKEHGAIRIGYLRQGAAVPVVPEAHPKPNCVEGWYELIDGGFVCGRYASLDMNHPRIKLAAHPPFLDQALPYQYGYNLTNGTPLYKSVPSRDERVKLEPWLKPKPKVKPVALSGGMDAGVTPAAVAVALTAANANPQDPLGVLGGVEDAGTPWYLRDYDGGKPQITLDDLKEDGGPIARRMVKGFYLALDKEVDTGPNKSTKWWRSTGGLLAPYERIFLAKPLTDFHGVWLGKDPPPEDLDGGTPQVDAGYARSPRPGKKVDFPVAFILWGHAHKYTLDDGHKKATATDVVRRFSVVQLTGEDATVGGLHYVETADGWWMREREGTVARTSAPPKDLAPGEKWIDVNLKTQTLVAFEGDKPVYATLVSTGRMDDEDKEKDHRTKPGTFRIREKHVAATMDGDVASDGPYSIEDVPWIMYFNASIALHGAFWHQNFGHVQSHGCVNLSPLDAKTLFGWTDPQLPTGWHGVEATADHPGTRVIVHDPPETKPKWATE